MAFTNKTIHNSRTGQHIRFLRTGKDTNGKLLEMEAIYTGFSKEPPAHYHPYQTEEFLVISGELTVRIEGELRTMKPGERLCIGRNQVHAMWNSSQADTVVNWKVEPALRTDHFLETLTGLANDGETNKDGRPGLLQVALIAGKYADVFRLAKPPFAVQRLVFALLTPFAYIFGYRPHYKRYLD